MTSEHYPMTQAGKEKLEKELTYLKEEKQDELSQEIKEHRGYCDFSENASFSQTLDQQTRVRERIAKIEEMLLNAVLIHPEDGKSSKVRLGREVQFIELPDGPVESYTIVSSIESDPLANKLSVDSPIGKKLLGSEEGDTITVETPAGKLKIKVLAVR